MFVYYYEVVARYVFNSPTNWVHESMFLMYGMQYMLAGAYAYREDQHVRVDVFYTQVLAARQGDRRHRHLGLLLHLHRHDAVDRLALRRRRRSTVGEVSFTEWGVQYWPVKLTIPIGAALLLLQGLAKLIKDIIIVTRGRSLSHGSRNRHRMADGPAVRLARRCCCCSACRWRSAPAAWRSSSCSCSATPPILNMMPSRIFPFMTDYQLSAVPLFIFMAAMLEKAGIIEELFDAVYKWLGALKGGLAAATVLACTALAAMVGVVGATEVTMGMIALPAMLRRGYDQKLACGSLLAGGTLGILIPPSVMAIVYAVVAQQSLGELLVGSIFPGFLLSGLYVGYITDALLHQSRGSGRRCRWRSASTCARSCGCSRTRSRRCC